MYYNPQYPHLTLDGSFFLMFAPHTNISIGQILDVLPNEHQLFNLKGREGKGKQVKQLVLPPFPPFSRSNVDTVSQRDALFTRLCAT